MKRDLYEEALLSARKYLIQSHDELSEAGAIDLTDPELPVTVGILRRLRAYYMLQDTAKKTYRKRIGSDGSDFFTETVAAYIQAAVRSGGWTSDDATEAYERGVFVNSEECLIKKKGQSRPDISFWRKGRPFAVIECKTQMGWCRDGWELEFNEREKKLQDEIPGIGVYHVILTEKNWPGLPPAHPNTGKKWFTLCSEWPNTVKKSDLSSKVLNPIEPLLLRLLGAKCV